MTRALAQALRRNMSALELRAWKLLRALRAEGVHVRRQHPIGRCVADFAVLRARLAIEIDGPLHQQQRDADAERDARFADLGWRVLRVTHKELDDEAGFLAAVRALAAPSPRGEGGRERASLPAAFASAHAREPQARIVSLKQRLIERIKETGPMTVADFMAACLYDPQDGYYATRPALGGHGADFLTAPEASQMFGELIGLWCAHEWEVMGKPALNLIELGPGRGVLMQDAWRATARIEGFHDAANVVFVETSGPLREAQAAHAPQAEWAERLEDAPPGPTLIIANEFLDCLPIRQFVRGEEGWHEKLVGLSENEALTFGLSQALPAPDDDTEPGAVREIAPGLDALIYEIERRLHAAPGRALLIDYGYVSPEGADTLQALMRHQKVDPLEAPGEADLTAHVDFARVAHLARQAGLGVAGPITQGAFLHALGIDVRAQMLSAHAEHAPMIARQLRRLTHAEEMGALFKAICLSSPNLPPPAGF